MVTARRSRWSSVTETLLLIGVFSSTLSLPQYLMQAMFDGAVHVSTSAGSTAMADLVLGGAARGATTALSARRIYIEI